jgi:hypothetical protein
MTSTIVLSQNISEDTEQLPDSYNLWTGVGIATGLDKANRPVELQQYSLSLWGYSQRHHAMRYTLTYIHSPIPEVVNANDFSSKNGLTIIDFALDSKQFYSEDFLWRNQYLFFGGGLALAFWNYSDSFLDKELASTFGMAVGVDLRIGRGIVFGHLKNFNTTIDISPGVILWLSNDEELSIRHRVPPTYFYLSARVGFNYSLFDWK